MAGAINANGTIPKPAFRTEIAWYKPAKTLVPGGMELIAGFPMSKMMKNTQSVTLDIRYWSS